MPRHPEVGAAKERKQAGKDERRAKVAAIRGAVFARAGTLCEVWVHAAGPERRCNGHAEIMDHWLGGNGRRRQKEAVETCWAICGECNDDRTANWPDAAWWNESFRLHCAAHGYRFTPHYDARAASRRTA
jgi:hypothetical protein